MKNGCRFAGMLVVVAAAMMVSACGTGPVVCTEVGCQSGIFFVFEDEEGSSVDSFAGDITVAGEVLSVSCSNGSGGGDRYTCSGNTLQLDVTGVEDVAMNIRSTDDPVLGHIGGVATPFEEVRPNGEDCPPVCQQARVTVTMVPTES